MNHPQVLFMGKPKGKYGLEKLFSVGHFGASNEPFIEHSKKEKFVHVTFLHHLLPDFKP